MAVSNEHEHEHELKRLASELAIQAWAEGGATDPSIQAKLLEKYPHITEQLRLEFKRLAFIELAFHDEPAQSTVNFLTTRSAAHVKGSNPPFDWTWRCQRCEITLRDFGAEDPSSSSERVCPKCGEELLRVQQADASASGDMIDHYRLERVLGAGGFGTVWLAFDEELLRPVALKIPKRGRLDAGSRKTFLREAQIAASVRHPMVVTVYDVGIYRDEVYICSEYIEGSTLAQSQTENANQPEAACRLVSQLCEPLQALHEAGIIHRDLKPSNILIDRSGVGRLTDFGLAKSLVGKTTNTLTGQVLGTPAYMAPEIVAGDSKHADPRTDIYSIGVVFYELLSTCVPFQGSWSELESAILHDQPPKLESFAPPWDIPRDLERVCLKCLEKNPKDRYQSVNLLDADLKRFLDGLPVHAKPKPLPLRIYRQIEKRPALSVAIALAMVSCVTIPYLFGTILGITQDNRELENANNAAEATIAELELQTEYVDRQAAIESMVREAEALADTRPQAALEMAIDVAKRVSAEHSPYLPEDRIARESQAYQLLVDLAIRNVGVQPGLPVGVATQIQLMAPNRLLIRNKVTATEKRSKFDPDQPQVDECFTVWLPNRVTQPPNNQIGKLREVNYPDVQPRDRFLVNLSAIVHYKHGELSPSYSSSTANNSPNTAANQLENYSVASPGTMTCYWKGLPAKDCVVSKDGRIVISLYIDGSVSAKLRVADSANTTNYVDIEFEGSENRVANQIDWLDDADILLVEAAGEVTALELQRGSKPWAFKPKAIWETSLDDIVCCKTTIGVHNKAAQELALYQTSALESIESKAKPYLQLPCDQVFDLWIPRSEDEIYVACASNGHHHWQKWNIKDRKGEQILAWDKNLASPKLIAHPTQDLAVLVGPNLWLLDASTGNLKTLMEHANSHPNLSRSAVAWLGTSRNLLIGLGTRLSLLDTALPNDSLQSAEQIFRQPSSVESVISSPKGDWIASLDRAGNTKIAGFPIRTTLQRTMISPGIEASDQSVQQLTQNASGNLFLCHYTSGLVEVLENKSIGGQQSWEKLFSDISINDAAIGNRTIAFLNRRRQLIAYSENTFESAFFHTRVPEGVRQILVSQDDRWLIAWGTSRVLTYDLSQPDEAPRVYRPPHAIRSLRLSSEQRELVILDKHPQLTVLDLASQDLTNQHALDADQPYPLEMPLIITNDYAFAISGGSIHSVATAPTNRDGSSTVGDKVMRESVRHTSLRFSRRQAPSIASWASKAGEGLFLIPRPNSLRVFFVGDARTQQMELWRGTDYIRQLRQWKLSEQLPLVSCDPNREWILAASDSDAWLWHLADENLQGPVRLPIDSNSSVTAAIFSLDGRFLVLGFESGEVCFWPLSSDGKVRGKVMIPISTDPIEKLIFLNAGERLVIGCSSGVFQVSLDVATFANQLDTLLSQSRRVRSQMAPRL